MSQSALVASGYKELRALLPTWLACVLVLVAAWSIGWRYSATLAFVFGSVGLGAQAIGHEYSYRTLGLLLSHPRGRPSAYALKLGVLGILLGSLALIWLQVVNDAPLRFPTKPQVVLLVVACSLFLAPALTMLCRNTLGAGVFATAIPGMIFLGADVIGLLRFGRGRPGEIDAFREAVFAPAIYVVCGIAALAGWWLFMRLEAIDGRGSDIQMPQWLRGRAPAAVPVAKRRGPVRALIGKELHLHHMALVVAGLYVTGIAIFAALRYYDPLTPSGYVVEPLTFLYIGALPTIIGAMASAEERELGTAQWQLLMPMASWKQWMVKVAVAVGLALLLGAGIPALLSQVWSNYPHILRRSAGVLLVVPLIVASSLYVSSLVNSGIRAIVLAVAAMFAAAFSTQFLMMVVFRDLWRVGLRQTAGLKWGFLLLATVTLASILISMAHRNHSSPARRPALVLAQVALLAVVLTAATLFSVLLRL